MCRVVRYEKISYFIIPLSKKIKEIKMSKKCMTQSDVSRVQSATAKQNGGQTPKNSFASRSQSAVAKGTCSVQGDKK